MDALTPGHGLPLDGCLAQIADSERDVQYQTSEQYKGAVCVVSDYVAVWCRVCCFMCIRCLWWWGGGGVVRTRKGNGGGGLVILKCG